MSISLQTHKMLWARSGNICAICRIELHDTSKNTGEGALIGETCHIVSKKENGPRSKSELPVEDRNKVNNLILLCPNHHRLIDSQIEEYSVVKLMDIKGAHEKYVRDAIKVSIDQEEMALISTVDLIANKARFEAWDESFAGIIYSSELWIQKDYLNSLVELREHLFRRFRGGKYQEIESEIDNFSQILRDFINVFRRYIDYENDSEDRERYFTKKFYRIDYHDPEMNDKLLDKYNYHSDLLEDLVLELTRSANRIIMLVRTHVLVRYRENEGFLILRRGMDVNEKEVTYIPKYRSNEEKYSSLNEFVNIRAERSEGIGKCNKHVNDYL